MADAGQAFPGSVRMRYKETEFLHSKEDQMLRHSATMPVTYDSATPRPFCDGMWKTSQVSGFVLGAILLFLPIVARPIPLYTEANAMLGITLLCGAFWAFEVIPIYATALLPVVLMPFFLVTSSENCAKAYWRPINMLVIGTYLVDIALMQSALPKRIVLRLTLSMKKFSPGLLLFLFMLITWTLALFINNIAVAILLTPFASSLVLTAEEEARDAELLAKVDGSSSDEAGSSDDENDDDSDNESRIKEGASLREVERLGKALMLGIAFSANSGGLATLTGCIPNEVLMGTPSISTTMNYRRWMALALPVSVAAGIVSFVVIYLRYLKGSALKGMRMDAWRHEHTEFLARTGYVSRDELAVAFVAALQVTLLFIRPFIGKYFEGPDGQQFIYDEVLAVGCAMLLFLIPSVVKPGGAVLRWHDVQEHFDFGLLLLIGGGYAVSSGFKESGLNIALAHNLHHYFLPDRFFTRLFVVLVIATVFTQVFSSIAASAILLPAFMSVAIDTLNSPYSYLLPATIGCSFGFVLPAAAAPNIIVMNRSNDFAWPLRNRDFLQTGILVALVMLGLGTGILALLGEPVFAVREPFPRWACDGVACMWVPVAGVVDSTHVDSQACALLDDTNGSMCKLWNGTMLATAPFLDMAPWIDEIEGK